VSRALAMLAAALCLCLTSCQQPDALPQNAPTAVAEGWNLLSTAEYDRAEELFTHAASLSKDDKRTYLLARFGLANVYQHRKPTPQLAEAEQVFNELVAADANGDLGGWSCLAIARIHHIGLYEPSRVSQATGTAASMKLPTGTELDTVRADYQRVMDLFPKTMAAEEAAVFYGASFVEQIAPAEVQRGIDYLKDWIARNKDSYYAGQACAVMAAGYELLKQWEPMIEALINSEDAHVYPEAEKAGLYYRIASIAEQLAGKPEIAKKYYRKILDGFPTDFRTFWCRRALKRLGVEVADPPLGGHQ
jgi:tetratricopeptide (TPR) repeat protein